MLSDNRNKESLLEIMNFIRKIENVEHRAKTELGLGDELIQDLFCFELQQIGESSNKISEDLKNKYPNVLWNEIKGLRNIIAHEYGNVDNKILLNTISEDVPILKKQIMGILKKEFQLDIKTTSNRIEINLNKAEEGKGLDR